MGQLARVAFTLDARSLALFRMALGALLCVDCLLRTRDFRLMFAVDGIFPPEAIRRFLSAPTLWSLAFLDDATWWNGVVLGLEGVAGAFLAVGCGTRLATAVGWAALVSVIRRASPASNGGDLWLACQLFWALFLPLGAAWSVDARRAERRGIAPTSSACSVATAALVLQMAAIYVSAGLAKCNDTWTAGTALAHALSVHDHGTPLGMALVRSGVFGPLLQPLTWGVLALEIAGPVAFVVCTAPRVRLAIALTFIAFHAAIWLTMSVGLFAPVSIAAWLPLLPSIAWERQAPAAIPTRVAGLGRPATIACGTSLALAAASLVANRVWPGPGRLPAPLRAALDVTALHQDWAMFSRVPPLEQWVYARAELADGRVVDLLRGGRPCVDERPAGGFTTLPHHRWHKLCWVLGDPALADVAPAVAAGLARRWNETHADAERVISVEIRAARQPSRGGDRTEYERLVATWPRRTEAGGGNLDRLLQGVGVGPTVGADH